MVIFLNFAPIEFMGGAEKWMLQTALNINKKEKAILVSMAPNLANIYGRLVLKREFSKRGSVQFPYEKLSFESCIPFTKKWKQIRNTFKTARIIYTKYELAEILIILYFGGFKTFKKSIAGIHTPFLYANPDGFFGEAHNMLYTSKLSQVVLQNMRAVHVLNIRDEKFMIQKFNVKHVFLIPNTIKTKKITSAKSETTKNLKVLFVGELSVRKGVDTLLKIIKKRPEYIGFTIAGDGPLRSRVKKEIEGTNAQYLGHIDQDELSSMYASHDVLLLPSRAESMSLTVLEALSHGLVIVNSHATTLALDPSIEYSVDTENIHQYLNVLTDLQKNKKQLDREKIKKYFDENFNESKINQKINKHIFNIS